MESITKYVPRIFFVLYSVQTFMLLQILEVSMAENQPEMRTLVYCRNCSAEVTSPEETGFELEGEWFCSAFCAETCSGFWSRGYELVDGEVVSEEATA